MASEVFMKGDVVQLEEFCCANFVAKKGNSSPQVALQNGINKYSPSNH